MAGDKLTRRALALGEKCEEQKKSGWFGFFLSGLLLVILGFLILVIVLESSPSAKHKTIDFLGQPILCLFARTCSVDRGISDYVTSELNENMESVSKLRDFGIERIFYVRKMLGGHVQYTGKEGTFWVSGEISAYFFSDLYIDLKTPYATVIADRNSVNKDDVPEYISNILKYTLESESKRLSKIVDIANEQSENIASWES